MKSFISWKDRPIRVLYVIPGTPSGSDMIFAQKQIAHFKRIGLETRTFMLEVSTNLRKVWSQMRAQRRLVLVYRPSIVHAHYGSLTGFICALVSFVSRVPLVITYRGSDLNPSPSDGVLRSAAQKLLSRLAALGACGIICVSRQVRDKLWWGRRKAVVIPSGVDMELFQLIPQKEARRRLGWGDDERIVLFNAGRTPVVKRLDLAEASVALMRKLIGEVRLIVLYGDTPHDEMPLYLSGADCVLMTSDYEGSPNIVKEALACGLPIVSVDVGDIAERLDGVHPSRIVACDARAIGSAAAEIVLSGQRSNGRDAIRNLSATAVRDKILEVYHRVLGGARYGN